MYMHADLVVLTAGLHLLPLTHVTSATLKPEWVPTWSLKLPFKWPGNQETLHQEVAGVAVVGALVGATTPLPVAVESAVIHICTSTHFTLQMTTQ